MRRLISKHEENKKRKRNQIIIGLILIFVMFFSVLGFAFVSFSFSGGRDINKPSLNSRDINNLNLNSINYNGFEFREQNGFWILNKDNINFIFRNNPNQVAKTDSVISPLNNYLNRSLYINSESIEAESEIKTNLLQFVKKIENACLEGCNNNEELPIKSCEDNFIIIKEISENEPSGINQENNCVFIKGKKADLVKLTDEFLFKLLGVEG